MLFQDWDNRPALWKMAEVTTSDDDGLIMAAGEFNVIVQRLIDHPDEARWRAPHGDNFLHHILGMNISLSSNTIEKILEVICPESLQERNMYGMLPLHMVSCLDNNHHDPEIFSLILNANPDAARICDHDGDYPINKALYWSPFWSEESKYYEEGKLSPPRKMLSNSNISIVRMILEVHPSGALVVGEYGIDIWQILCFLWLRDGLDDYFTNLCELTDTVLRSRFMFRCGKDVPFLHLHAVVQERNDVLMIRKLRKFYLGRYSHQASILDHNGRLCLNLAIETGYQWSNAIAQLCHVASRAIETRDMATFLFPFMAAAAREHADVNTVYELMRASPSLIRRCTEIARDFKC